MTGVLEFWTAHPDQMRTLLEQHVALVVAATLAATVMGVPLGALAFRRPRLGAPVLAAASIVQTIPSLAIFGFLLPLPFVGGIGARTALIALILYGLLPVIRTTAAALASVDASLREAALAMGLTSWQRLRHVELPLALPGIVAGIRVAAVTGVGTATIAAAIGAGGLGELIFRGLSMLDPHVILAGAIPAAALALAADGLLGWCARLLRPRRRRTAQAVAAGIGVLGAGALALPLLGTDGAVVVVGSKNFTEQVILGELVAQTLERETALRVERRLNLGGTFVCDRALRTGDIDVYVEYTGTALTAIFKQDTIGDRGTVTQRVRELYAEAGVTALEPLGFDNTFAMLVRRDTAERHALRTLSDAVPYARHWRAGVGYEFLERPDGFRGLAARYGLTLAAPPTVMDLNLSYRALANGDVDLIAGDATAGLIAALDLVMLEDDRNYFPPYDALPVVSTSVLLRYPAVRAALARLAARVGETEMRAMNAAVDVEKRDAAAVVREFLDRVLGGPTGRLRAPRTGAMNTQFGRAPATPRALR
jgi:osmoprotectant transport system permease protein